MQLLERGEPTLLALVNQLDDLAGVLAFQTFHFDADPLKCESLLLGERSLLLVAVCSGTQLGENPLKPGQTDPGRHGRLLSRDENQAHPR